MALGIYKPGQGYWTRTGTAVGLGVAFLAGAAWLWGELAAVRIPLDEATGQPLFEKIYLQAGVAAPIVLLGVVLTYWLVGLHPKVNEFLINVDQEMRKVNWSTRREIIGSTWVVIFVAVALAALLFGSDLIFAAFFRSIRLLQGG